ncbi:MAG: O-acetyl-ADP-ribose deacetylase [Actinomycetia bacterium]|nr:O-acetyl-ADP-ribose deacetylase [Actinomycetes bacterium]
MGFLCLLSQVHTCGVRIVTARGNIAEEDVDAIVNAANASLARGAGVCGAIFAAAGPELDAACAGLSCSTGEAVATPGFHLPARWVIHAVGPVWQGGDRGEPDELASCYRRSLEVADELGARSIAFPALSTGIYGYPKREAAEIAVQALRGAATAVEVARLVAFDAETYDLYRTLLA